MLWSSSMTKMTGRSCTGPPATAPLASLDLPQKCTKVNLTAEQNSARGVVYFVHQKELLVIDRNYFRRQAATLLKFAKATRKAEVAAALLDKAADLKSQNEEPPPLVPDRSPLPPDVLPPSK